MNGSHLLRVSPAAPGTGSDVERRELWIVKSFILKSLASQIDIWFWQTICSNSFQEVRIFWNICCCSPIFNGFELRVQLLGWYLQNTWATHSVVSSLSRSQSSCYSPGIYYLKVNIKWQVSDRLFRYCEKIELTRKAGLEVWASPPSLSESGSRPFQCGKTYKSLDLD